MALVAPEILTHIGESVLPPARQSVTGSGLGIINRPSHRYAARHDGVVWQRRGRWI